VRAVLARYDALAARADRRRAVLTHGEPHPGNTMRTAAGWRLIDWDTVLVAPPERDLWLLGAEAAPAYEAATGVAVLPEMLQLYRMRWDLADLAVGVDRFAAPHAGSADDDETWAILERIVTALPER
jgi:spectinomycin phosphotransferase/16S rRNA (guanine(1405)-N(7))-methyltransferase